MKDFTEFERYLIGKLLAVDDCCVYCTHTPPDKLCDSYDEQDCCEGIWKYFELHKEEA